MSFFLLKFHPCTDDWLNFKGLRGRTSLLYYKLTLPFCGEISYYHQPLRRECRQLQLQLKEFRTFNHGYQTSSTY